MIRASELAGKFLNIALPPAAAPAAPAVEGAAPVDAPAKTEPALSVEERAKLARLQGDLMWLVREGYVTEFIDGRLFAPPPMVEARKKEVESEEHDPENFPEAPVSASSDEAQPAETPAPAEVSKPDESSPTAPAATESPAAEVAPESPAP